MKTYFFKDNELSNNQYEEFSIKADNEEEAWAKLSEKHKRMKKGGSTYGIAKERYKLTLVK